MTPSSLATHHHSRPRADKTDFPAASTNKRTSENSWSGLVFTVGLETILYNWRILLFFEWSKRFQTWSSLKESSVAGSAMDWFGHVSIWSSSSSNGFRPTCSASSRERYSSEDSDMMLQMSFTKSCSARRFSSTPWKQQIIQRMNNLLWKIIGEHLGNGCIQQPLVDTPFVFHMNLVSWKCYIFLKMNLVCSHFLAQHQNPTSPPLSRSSLPPTPLVNDSSTSHLHFQPHFTLHLDLRPNKVQTLGKLDPVMSQLI